MLQNIAQSLKSSVCYKCVPKSLKTRTGMRGRRWSTRREAGMFLKPDTLATAHWMANLGVYCDVISYQTVRFQRQAHSHQRSGSDSVLRGDASVHVLHDSISPDAMAFLILWVYNWWIGSSHCHHLWSCSFILAVIVQWVGQCVLIFLM